MATLTVNMPSVVNSITFTNGNTATNQSGTGYISYSSAVKISSVFITGRYSSWSGTLYWSNGTNTFAFATVNNGSVSVYSTSSQESIDYTGNRTITVTAVQSSATLTVNMPSVVNSITFTNGNTATNRSGTGYISYSSAVKIRSVSIAGGYSSWSGTLYWSNGTNTFAFATVNNGSVSVYSTSSQESIDYTGNRTIIVTAVQSSTTIYYKYRYIVESTGATLEDSSVYSVPTELSPAVAYVTLSNIPQPTNTDYVKTGSYIVVAHCSINREDGYASCSGTSASDPSIIGVKVQFNKKIFYYQYQYIKPDGSVLETSNIYAKGATLQTTSITVKLSDIPQPTNTDYVKTGSYSVVAHCSINQEDGYASCSSTSTSDPSIIGVKVQFNKKIFYYQYQYIKPDGSILETSNIYAKGATLSTTSITVKLSDIPQPTSSGYTKTGSYTVVAHCSINLEDGYASCSSTSTSDPSIIGVKVRPTIKIFYYQYRYLTPNGRTIKNSNIYAQDATYFDSQISVRLVDIPDPNVGRWRKSGQYSNVAHCSFDMEGGYALCSSTSTADPSIIGVYCEQEPITRFTWLGSDPQDNAAFASGKYISDAITASGWNAMYAKIKELAEATGGQFDYDTVSKGDQITATEFNYMRLGIINLPWHGSLPNAVAADMPIFADYFNGSVSLKSALNAAIDGFNNQ